MKLKKTILLAVIAVGLTTPSSQAITAGAAGEALFKMLIMKSTETVIFKLVDNLVTRGLARPVPETYENTASPSYYEDRFTGFMGNTPPTVRDRKMWLDPVNGAPYYVTSTANAGQPAVIDRNPFQWVPHTRYHDCVDPNLPRKYNYRITAALKYRVRNQVVRANPEHGVPLHPLRLVLSGERLSENCQTPPAAVAGTLVEMNSVTVPRNGFVDVNVRTMNLLLSSERPSYETN